MDLFIFVVFREVTLCGDIFPLGYTLSGATTEINVNNLEFRHSVAVVKKTLKYIFSF